MTDKQITGIAIIALTIAELTVLADKGMVAVTRPNINEGKPTLLEATPADCEAEAMRRVMKREAKGQHPISATVALFEKLSGSTFTSKWVPRKSRPAAEQPAMQNAAALVTPPKPSRRKAGARTSIVTPDASIGDLEAMLASYLAANS